MILETSFSNENELKAVRIKLTRLEHEFISDSIHLFFHSTISSIITLSKENLRYKVKIFVFSEQDDKLEKCTVID